MNRRISYILASAVCICIIITHLTSCRCTVMSGQMSFANDYSLMLWEGDSLALWENSSPFIRKESKDGFYTVVRDAHSKLHAWGKPLQFYKLNSQTLTGGDMLQNFIYIAKAPNNSDSLMRIVISFSSSYPDKLSGIHVNITKRQSGQTGNPEEK